MKNGIMNFAVSEASTRIKRRQSERRSKRSDQNSEK